MIGLIDENLAREIDIPMPNMIELSKDLPSPRTLKTHVTLDMLSKDITKKGKVLYWSQKDFFDI